MNSGKKVRFDDAMLENMEMETSIFSSGTGNYLAFGEKGRYVYHTYIGAGNG